MGGRYPRNYEPRLSTLAWSTQTCHPTDFIFPMSDKIKHECGIALIRLLKPLDYYVEKYGSPLHGFNKLFLLMEKQHNRGQDGAGIGCVKLNMQPGEPFMFRERDIKANPLAYIFKQQLKNYNRLLNANTVVPEFPETVKRNFDFGGEVLIGHLRYGTSGAYGKRACHPYSRKSLWPTRNLMLAGNFNMTNERELNAAMASRGAHPIFDTDTQTVLEEIGYHLDEEHTRIYHELRDAGMPGDQIPRHISEQLDPLGILRLSSTRWDGGYVIGGLIGNGDCFVLRDPLGIRPAFYFQDEEVVAFASERVALMTIFNKGSAEVREVEPGNAVVIKANGRVSTGEFTKPAKQYRGCSFERIYFSRGNDPEIYQERKALGAALVGQILKEIDEDFVNSVFSYIPNTAEVPYYGLMNGLREFQRERVRHELVEASKNGGITQEMIDRVIMTNWPRGEKIAHKDIKLRTFISQEKSRVQMASHVYDITYDVVRPDDVLVCVDDSIVRGTTLKQSIIRILARTNPRKIVIASTAPQIRYPDCYGIDMSELGKFIAFQAAVDLLKETGKREVIREVYQACVEQNNVGAEPTENHVKRIYEPFTAEQISDRISQLVTPKDMDWEGEVKIVYQSIENMLKAIPRNQGDWYFTGNYPTPGGITVVNRAFIHFYEKREGRSY